MILTCLVHQKLSLQINTTFMNFEA